MSRKIGWIIHVLINPRHTDILPDFRRESSELGSKLYGSWLVDETFPSVVLDWRRIDEDSSDEDSSCGAVNSRSRNIKQHTPTVWRMNRSLAALDPAKKRKTRTFYLAFLKRIDFLKKKRESLHWEVMHLRSKFDALLSRDFGLRR